MGTVWWEAEYEGEVRQGEAAVGCTSPFYHTRRSEGGTPTTRTDITAIDLAKVFIAVLEKKPLHPGLDLRAVVAAGGRHEQRHSLESPN